MRRWLPAALVALVAVAVYAHTIAFDFVYDDVPVVLRDDRIRSLRGWREILTGPYWPRGLYRPFTTFTFAVNWAAGGGSPATFHLVNVLAHAVASVLVLFLAATVLPPAAALAAALLFAVHPVHVEAVANVVGRAEVFATLGVLAAALLYRAHGDPGPRAPAPRLALAAAVLAAVLLALASKESAFPVPALLLAVDWAAGRAEGIGAVRRWRRHWGLWAAVVALTGAWLIVRTRMLGDLAGDVPAAGLAGTTVSERVVLMLAVVPEYLRLFFAPVRLSADYSLGFLPVSTAFTWRSAVGLLLLAATAAVAYASRARAPAVTFGAAWSVASLAVVGNILVPSGIVLAERTLYLASVGACVVLAWLWSGLYQRWRRAAWAVLLLVAAAGAARTWTRSHVWRDNTTFFPQLVRDAPGSYRSDWVAAMLAYMAGDSTGGERLLRRGLATHPGSGAMWSDLARQLERQRRWAEAGTAFWNAYAAESTLVAEAARSVANAVQAGALDTAEARLAAVRHELGRSPELQIAASHLALARGDVLGALRLREGVARRQPDDWRYWLLTAEAAVRARRCPELAAAVTHLERVKPTARFVPLLALSDSARALRCDPAAPAP